MMIDSGLFFIQFILLLVTNAPLEKEKEVYTSKPNIKSQAT